MTSHSADNTLPYLLLVLEPSLAEDDLLHTLAVAVHLFKRRVGVEQLLGFGLGNLVKSVLVHHTGPLILQWARQYQHQCAGEHMDPAAIAQDMRTSFCRSSNRANSMNKLWSR